MFKRITWAAVANMETNNMILLNDMVPRYLCYHCCDDPHSSFHFCMHSTPLLLVRSESNKYSGPYRSLARLRPEIKLHQVSLGKILTSKTKLKSLSCFKTGFGLGQANRKIAQSVR